MILKLFLLSVVFSFFWNTSEAVHRVPKKADKKIYIHLMPWFETRETSEDGNWGIHWTMGNKDPDKIIGPNDKREIAAYFYPEIHPYGSGDADVIDYQIQMMKYSGVDGILMDWPGTANAWDYPKNHRNAEAFINKLTDSGLDFAIVYEDHNLGMAHDSGLIEDVLVQGRLDMEYLRDNYFNRSNYVQLDGKPLLLTFGPQSLGTESDWTYLFETLSPKPTFLTLWNQMAQGGQNAQGEYPWVYFNVLDGLNNFYRYRQIPIKFGVAYPGFDSFYQDGGWPGNPGWTIPYEGVGTFIATLNLALEAQDVQYIQLATWNDYGEGTMIEPTREFGNLFLNVLQNTLAVPYGNRELNLIKELYTKRKEFVGRADIQDCLNEVNEALNNLEPDRAEKLLRNCS